MDFKQTLLGIVAIAIVGGAPALAGIGDVVKMDKLSDGNFSVVCKDGTTETVTADQISKNQVCLPTGGPSDIFNSAACSGTPLTAENALSLIPLPSKPTKILGNYEMRSRVRACYGNNCSDWNYSNQLPEGISSSWPLRLYRYTYKTPIPLTGKWGLKLADSKVIFFLRTAPWGSSGEEEKPSWFEANFSTPLEVSTNTTSPHYWDNIYFGGDHGEFRGQLTDKCLWLKASATTHGWDKNANKVFIEQELAILSTY